MKVSNPYGMNVTVKTPPQTIEKEQRQASNKARARFPHTPLGPSQKNNQSGKMKTPAYTPGTTPEGS